MQEEKEHHRLANYAGDIVNGRMDGNGTYWFETGTKYEGEFKDGMFHGNGTLFFPDGGKYISTWSNGIDSGGKYIFSDGLEFEEDDETLTGWRYCNRVWDRRFYKEITDGLRPVDRCMMSANCTDSGKPVHQIPDNCYDTGDGYYDPSNRVLYSYADNPEAPCKFVRNVTDDEHEWIVKTCRQGHDRFVGLQRIDDYSDVAKLSRQVGKMALHKAGCFGRAARNRKVESNSGSKRVTFHLQKE